MSTARSIDMQPATLDVRADFPLLCAPGAPIFLDSGASAQKPRTVIEAESTFYQTSYANIHRGLYPLSQKATQAYENARATVAHFLGAASPDDIVFTRNATESINLVAFTWGRANLTRHDAVLITGLEHHANIVPWQLLRDQIGFTLNVVPVADDGSLPLEAFKAALTPNTKLVAFSHMSNVLGTVTPARDIIKLAHANGALALVDGAQAVVHMAVDVQALDADFYVFTGHKTYGPTGIGVLYGREGLLADMPPYQGGGDMIEHVSFAKTTYAAPPARFEAGTPNIAGAVGLAAALNYMQNLGRENIAAHEQHLLAYATEKLSAVEGLKIIGTAPGKGAIISFTLEGAHPHDLGSLLAVQGICVRTGHHCAEPLLARYGISGTTRVTFGVYNTTSDIDALVKALHKAKVMLG